MTNLTNRKITKFIQVVIFSAHKVNDECSSGKLEKGRALASMMIAKEVPVFSLKTSEIEEMRRTGISQKTGDNMPEVSGVSAVIIDNEIVFCAAVGAVSSLELYEGHSTTSRAAATLGSIRTQKKAAASKVNGIKGGRPVVSRYAVADRPGYFGAQSRVYATHSRKDLAIREARKSIFTSASGERHVPCCVIAGDYTKGECIYATNFPAELVF